VQTSPGRGETGADISAIPTDAIERVEIFAMVHLHNTVLMLG
jgi:hypothetical protein